MINGEKGQAVVEYVLTVVFVGLAAVGSYALFRFALGKHLSSILKMLSLFIP